MYRIEKELEFSAAHKLKLSYPSKCTTLHGHNWKVKVYCKSETLNAEGMIVDFTKIKDSVSRLDHAYLNDLPCFNKDGINPTAENIARVICELIGETCYRVEVQETEGNVATYER